MHEVILVSHQLALDPQVRIASRYFSARIYLSKYSGHIKLIKKTASFGISLWLTVDFGNAFIYFLNLSLLTACPFLPFSLLL